MKRILYADDSKTSLALVDRFLSKLGYIVVAVGDGEQALAQVRKGPFYAILMDMRMPVMDGIAATGAIRALSPDKSATPIIGLTAGTDNEVRLCINSGMDLVLSKPIDFEALVEALASLATGAAFAPVAPPPPPPKPSAQGTAFQPINLRTLQMMVDDLGRGTVAAAFETFRTEAAEQLGGVALAAARRRPNCADQALANLMGAAQVFGGEYVCAIIADCRAKTSAAPGFLEKDFVALTQAVAILVELLSEALGRAPGKAA